MPGEIVSTFEKYDQALNKAFLAQYKLSIQLSLNGFSFVIFDKEANKFLGLGSFSTRGINTIDDYTAAFENFTRENEWLQLLLGSNRISLLYESEKSTLVPSSLFLNEEKKSIAQFNFQVPEGHEVLSDDLKNTDASIIYHLPKQLKALFDQIFPKYNLVSHAGVLIEILLLLYKNQPTQKRMVVHVRHSDIDIVITEGKKLLFFNSFRYTTKEDFLYYIIFVIEQLNLNPEEIDLKLCGLLDKKSDIFEFSYKYVRNIQFLKLSDSFSYSYLFSDIPEHVHFNLINSSLCE